MLANEKMGPHQQLKVSGTIQNLPSINLQVEIYWLVTRQNTVLPRNVG